MRGPESDSFQDLAAGLLLAASAGAGVAILLLSFWKGRDEVEEQRTTMTMNDDEGKQASE